MVVSQARSTLERGRQARAWPLNQSTKPSQSDASFSPFADFLIRERSARFEAYRAALVYHRKLGKARSKLRPRERKCYRSKIISFTNVFRPFASMSTRVGINGGGC